MNQYTDALSWIDTRADALIKKVRAWSAINSGSFNLEGIKSMVHEVETAFAVLGAGCERRNLTDLERIDRNGDIESLSLGPALHFKKRENINRRVLLTGHLDTVFPPDHTFQESRFLDDNTLNGPGVADMKGGLLVMLTALEAFERSPFANKLGYEIIISPDEEIGSPGSIPLLMERAAHADFGMTFEPALSDGTLAGARKGNGYFTFVVRGKSAHAGRAFDEGRNAVTHLARLIAAVDELNQLREGITINVAIIEGGLATNMVPDLAICRTNVRISDESDQHWIDTQIKALAQQYDAAVGFSVELHGGFNRPPKVISPANQKLFDMLETCGSDLGVPISFRPTGGCCEGNNLAAAGLPNIDTLGVRGGLIHSDKEFACVDSFTERAKLSALLLMKYAAGEFDLRGDDEKA